MIATLAISRHDGAAPETIMTRAMLTYGPSYHYFTSVSSRLGLAAMSRHLPHRYFPNVTSPAHGASERAHEHNRRRRLEIIFMSFIPATYAK